MFALVFSGSAFSQAMFNVITVPGARPNALIAINNSSVVVVNSNNQVSVWTRNGGTQNLVLSGTNTSGAAINSAGDVVGAADPSHTGVPQAFFWQPAGGLQWLGSLGSGLSVASGMNDAGAAVGFSYTATNKHAFLWTAAGGMQDLTPALTTVSGATAMDVNSANQVVGYYVPNGSLKTVGFLWTQAGGLQNLGPAGTLAFAVNDPGTVVGQMPIAGGNRHAFSWTQAGGLVDLGTLGGPQSSALSINRLGWIVGTSVPISQNGFQHGFLWTQSAGMQDLNTLTPSLASKNQQTYSVQVNDAGVIALSSNKGGFVLSPKMTAKLASSLNPSVSGQAVTFTATLTSIVGAPPDGEIVQFTMDGNALGSAALSGGVAQITTSSIAVGRHTVIATYVGDVNYLSAKSPSVIQVVN